MRLVHTSVILALLALLLAGCLPNTDSTPASTTTLQLTDCQLAAAGTALRISAQCGRLSVPENYADDNGRQIDLNIAILPAVSRSPAPDPIFFIAGGPGEAATQAFVALHAYFATINQKHDIVLVDQRGAGQSNPLVCPESDIEDVSQALQECLAAMPGDVTLYTTSIAMHDLDRVRQALGYAQINIYGASYGTRAAIEYARLYPQAVRSLVLDGVAPPGWPIGADSAANGQRALEMIFARCAAEQACKEAFPNLPESFDSLMQLLETAPVEIAGMRDPTNGETMTYTLTRDLAARAIFTLSYAPETAALLPLLIHTAAQDGDLRPLASQAIITAQASQTAITYGMYYSIVCSEDLPLYPTETPPGYLGSAGYDAIKTVCASWPSGEAPAGFHHPSTLSVPALLLSGETDPATPPSNAEKAARYLPNNLQIVAPGQGHIIIQRGCISKIVAEFIAAEALDNQMLPELDTACVAEIQPFGFFLNFNAPQP